jgi:hypothetical protein
MLFTLPFVKKKTDCAKHPKRMYVWFDWEGIHFRWSFSTCICAINEELSRL